MLHKFNARIGSHAGGPIVACGAVLPGAAMRVPRLLAQPLSPLPISPLASATPTPKSLTATRSRIGGGGFLDNWSRPLFIDPKADTDVVFGFEGVCVILGQGGTDVLFGNAGVGAPQGEGADYIDGSQGNDTLYSNFLERIAA